MCYFLSDFLFFYILKLTRQPTNLSLKPTEVEDEKRER